MILPDRFAYQDQWARVYPLVCPDNKEKIDDPASMNCAFHMWGLRKLTGTQSCFILHLFATFANESLIVQLNIA